MYDRDLLDNLVRWVRTYDKTHEHDELVRFTLWVFDQYGYVPPQPKELETIDDLK